MKFFVQCPEFPNFVRHLSEKHRIIAYPGFPDVVYDLFPGTFFNPVKEINHFLQELASKFAFIHRVLTKIIVS